MSTPILEETGTAVATRSENCLPIGARVAEFEITGIVGEGGFGIVYLAFDHSLQRVVALKEYMPGVMAGRGNDHSVLVRSKRHQDAFDTGLRSFINEARLLAQFDHPALIKIHRFWEQNNTGYMAMRYYEGLTLKRILQDDPGFVTEAWLMVMLQSILEALEALYRVQVLHRDISPENIMIQTNGAAVLLDFGAARQIISDMTQALTVILKPGYAPIEQYADDPSMLQGPWTDIYSLAAVIYVAIAKKTPPSSVARMIQDPITPLADGIHPGFSQRFLKAIDQGLAVKPEHRPQSIQAFRALLGIEAGAVPLAPVSHAPAGVALAAAAGDKARAASAAPSVHTVSITGDVAHTRAFERTTPASRTAFPDPLTQPMATEAPEIGSARAGVAGAPVASVMNTVDDRTATASPAPRSAGKSRMIAVGVGAAVMVGAVLFYRSDRVPSAAAAAAPAAIAPVVAEQVVDEETLAWETLRQKPDASVEQVTGFIAKYPNGRSIDQARAKLAELKLVKPAAAGAAPVADPAPATAAQAAPTDAEAAPVAVALSIKPWGTVFVDGADKGVSPPLKKLMLTEGKHQFKVSNPNFADYVTEIEVSRKKPARLTMDFAPAGK